jgi:uncharacterized integral membrane protein
MTLLETDLIAIIIALGGLIYVTFLGMFQIRKLEIENKKLRMENTELIYAKIKA